jgi:hypothetical protein
MNGTVKQFKFWHEEFPDRFDLIKRVGLCRLSHAPFARGWTVIQELTLQNAFDSVPPLNRRFFLPIERGVSS